jgi:hypothetical protein
MESVPTGGTGMAMHFGVLGQRGQSLLPSMLVRVPLPAGQGFQRRRALGTQLADPEVAAPSGDPPSDREVVEYFALRRCRSLGTQVIKVFDLVAASLRRL